MFSVFCLFKYREPYLVRVTKIGVLPSFISSLIHNSSKVHRYMMDVLKQRGHKRTGVTLLRSSLSKFITLKDVDQVKCQLEKLNAAFKLYESANNEVLVAFEDDPDRYDKEALGFVEQETLYIDSVNKANNYLEGGNATEPTSVEVMSQLINIPKVELKSFDGKCIDFLSFMAIFDETVDNAPISGQAKLTRLLGFTSGKARSSIDHCSLIGGVNGYKEARTILRERFGDYYTISTQVIENLQSGKPVHSAEELRTLADHLNSAKLMLKSTNTYSELDGQHNIKTICSRLSKHLLMKWRDRVFSIKREHKRYANFEEFVNFVSTKSDEANDPLYGQSFVPTTATNLRSSRKPVTNLNSVSSFKPSEKCVLCKRDHPLYKCKQFKDIDIAARTSVVSNNHLCGNCLRSDHSVDKCKFNSFCRAEGCSAKHNYLLHVDNTIVNNSVYDKHQNDVFMPIVHALINNTVKINCLLDTGSTSSFITNNLVSRLGLTCSQVSLNLMTLNKSVCKQSSTVDFTIQSMSQDFSIDMKSIFVVNSIPGRSYMFDSSDYPYLSGIDVIDNFDGHIDLLLGQDYADCFIPLQLLKGNKNEPYAVRTPLGYVLHGPNSLHSTCHTVVSNFITTSQIEEDIAKLWDFDQFDLSSETCMSLDDNHVKSFWDKETNFVDGHWQIPIPWKDDSVPLCNNVNQAKARLFALQAMLNKKSQFESYDSEVNKLLSNDYAEYAPATVSEGKTWYIPHHCVPKKNNKLRLVFDCACKFRGMSLNSQIHQGPDLINKLHFVLLRFRQHHLAITSDVESMYNQVKVPQHDRDALRFLWFEGGNVKHYRMTSHLFGGVWCSSCSGYALHRSAQHSSCDPNVKHAIYKSFYVDDMLLSVDDVQYGIHLISSVKETLHSSGFNLTKFTANDAALLCNISDVDKGSMLEDKVIQLADSKTLGVMWNVNQDCFYFHVNIVQVDTVTRRHILSSIASIFDPLGLVSPIIIAGKVIFQETTMLKLDWDEPVPEYIVDKWYRWLDTLDLLSDVKIPRCVKPHMYSDSYLELHSFSDASEHSYGCCIYLRCVSKSGVYSSLIYAKHRLAPIKSTTIPRLELQAAVLSAKVSSVVRSELDISISESFYWSDSMIVLSYIKNHSRRFMTFVANRLSIIHQLTDVDDWHHISGEHNPADIVSRGTSPDSLVEGMWLEGPSFLRKYRSDWNLIEPPVRSIAHDDVELKSKVVVNVSAHKYLHPIDLLSQHYSSWYRFKKALAWILRLKDLLLHRSTPSYFLSVDELKKSEIITFRHIQSEYFSEELFSLKSGRSVSKTSRLFKLNPIIDDRHLLVVLGRLTNALIPDVNKCPVIVPHDHHIASMIVRDIHGSAHLGQEWVISLVRSRFWITNIRNLVKRISRECIVCKKRFSTPGHQQMADLPQTRVSPHHPPFFHIGLDCFGPFFVTYGRSQIKRYGVVFSCFTTRAVHFEKINTLETDSLINALRRFIARRGSPCSIYCDNGTNLTGSFNELKLSLKSLSQADVNSFCRSKGIEWKFAPPQSSHMGGVYERMIRTFRKVFAGVLNPNTRLTDEILETVFCEVEGIINGRPITKVTTDIHDFAALTPNHLLLLRGDIKSAPGVFSCGDMYRKRWRHVQGLANSFWKRWLSSYLPDLQSRVKWQHKTRNLCVGDLVLISDVSSPRGSWPLGLVKEVNVGRDGLVRSARVKTASTELVRPVTKLILLEGYDDKT